MDYDEALEFLSGIDNKYAANATLNGSWVITNCPLAQWTHLKKADLHPSFGIKLNTESPPFYNCFTCGGGTLSELCKRLHTYTGINFSSLYSDNLLVGPPAPHWNELGRDRGSTSPSPVLREILLKEQWDIYEEAEGHPYLIDRGISNKTIKKLGIKIDPDNYGVERVLFPCFYRDGIFAGYTGRATDDTSEPRYRDYFKLPKSYILMGTQCFNESQKFVILVEGPFDYAKVCQNGYSALATLHAGLSGGQRKVLLSYNKPVYCFFDSDKAGADGIRKVYKAIGNDLPVMVSKYPPGKKDPGSLTKKELLIMLRHTSLISSAII